MILELRLKPGVAERLVWSRPDSTITPFCSLCRHFIPADEVPVTVWDDEGACVHFCDDCQDQLEIVPPLNTPP